MGGPFPARRPGRGGGGLPPRAGRRGTDRKLIWPWAGLADCAHFLSRCLEAGGLTDIREIAVPTLVKTLQSRAYTKTLAEQVDRAAGQRIVDSGILEPGDMLGYFNIDPNGDYGGAAQYSHSAMFVGKISSDDDGRITCHTKSRFGGLSSTEDCWWLSDSYKYTFIHIGMDDPRPAAALAGWWSVPRSGTTGYCLVSADGHARWTSEAPASPAARLDAPEDTAYWFQQGDCITFTWRRSGTVAVWAAGASAGAYDVSENGAPTGGTAAKLF